MAFHPISIKVHPTSIKVHPTSVKVHPTSIRAHPTSIKVPTPLGRLNVNTGTTREEEVPAEEGRTAIMKNDRISLLCLVTVACTDLVSVSGRSDDLIVDDVDDVDDDIN